jgi:hypothetical protein
MPVYIITGISPNTWCARSGNHRGNTIRNRKSRAFYPVKNNIGFTLQQSTQKLIAWNQKSKDAK